MRPEEIEDKMRNFLIEIRERDYEHTRKSVYKIQWKRETTDREEKIRGWLNDKYEDRSPVIDEDFVHGSTPVLAESRVKAEHRLESILLESGE